MWKGRASPQNRCCEVKRKEIFALQFGGPYAPPQPTVTAEVFTRDEIVIARSLFKEF